MTPAQPEPSEYERVKIFSLVKDEDGSISRVPICLCELCRVNHFLCPRYASHSKAAGNEREKVLADYRRGVLAGVERCLLRSDFNNVRKILDHEYTELRQQGEREQG